MAQASLTAYNRIIRNRMGEYPRVEKPVVGAVPPVKSGDRLKQAGWNLELLPPTACVHHGMAPPTIKWLGGGIS